MKHLQLIQRSQSAHWVGDGFPVRTLFSYNDLAQELSPFLMLDYAGPTHFEPSTHQRGVGEHPHRGFETVTIVYAGEVSHRDSTGAGGTIGAGDVQWMTAGAGLVHEEFHSPAYSQSGGPFEVVQLWVNLPARHKMTAPRYQGIEKQQIPEQPLYDVHDGHKVHDAHNTQGQAVGAVQVIAGAFTAPSAPVAPSAARHAETAQSDVARAPAAPADATAAPGILGPAQTMSPMQVWNIRLQAGARVQLPASAGHTTAFFVRQGQVQVLSDLSSPPSSDAWPSDATAAKTPKTQIPSQDQDPDPATPIAATELAVLSRQGENAVLFARQDSQLLWLSGAPLNEPIVGHGPFVMNTAAEIRQAFLDFQSGRMGHLSPDASRGPQ